jgi:hypothetical protein
MLYTLAWVAAITVPYALMTLGGVLLWKRSRSFATAMIGLGFLAALAGDAVGLGGIIQLSNVLGAHPGSTYFIVEHFHMFPFLIRYVGLVGLWAAAVGLVWHSLRGSRARVS